MSLKKFISTIDYSLIRDVIVKFLKSKENLQEDYTLEELETFFENDSITVYPKLFFISIFRFT